MAPSKFLSAALVAAMTLVAVPVLAQDAGPKDAPVAPRPMPPKAASIKLNFGAGRQVAIACGDTSFEACVAAAMPVIEKVATTPAVEPSGPPHGFMMERGGRPGPKGDHGGHDRKGPPPAMGGADAPPPAAN